MTMKLIDGLGVLPAHAHKLALVVSNADMCMIVNAIARLGRAFMELGIRGVSRRVTTYIGPSVSSRT